MDLIDRKKILEANPQKRLIIAHDKLVENYNVGSADEYHDVYKDQSLSFIIENSSLIFSEPYYGYDFYKNIILGPVEYGIFHEYKNELEKIDTYLEDHRERMSEDQLAMYESLREKLSNKISKNKNAILVSEYIREQHEDNSCVDKMLDLLYESYLDDISESRLDAIDTEISLCVDSFQDDKRYFLYGPIICEKVMALGAINTFIHNAASLTAELVTESGDNFRDFVEDVMVMNSLMKDEGYSHLLNEIPSRFIRQVFESFGVESPNQLIDDLFQERVKELDTLHVNPKMTVNSLFESKAEDDLFKEDYDLIKEHRLSLKKEAYDAISSFLLFEYHHCDDPEAPVCCDLFSKNTSIEQAFMEASMILHDLKADLGIVTESDDEDDDDEDLRKFDQTDDEDITDDDVNRVFNDKPIKNDAKGDKSSKKAKAPEPRSVANRIQHKAMDMEAKQMKKMADRKQKGQEIKGAIKAVTNLPNNVIKSIKQTIRQGEEASNKKRKDYMVAPGYRKKIFRNLKLAILYGSTAQVSLALLPVTAFIRHFSKQKDRRLRNELLSELDVEIKVCDEKINDAGGAGDNKEKYKLMRIKAELERERLRVRTNSKYI